MTPSKNSIIEIFFWLFAGWTFTAPCATETVLVNRDTWVSGVGKEVEGNNGASDKLKLKGIQEFTLIDGDFSPFRGRAVRRAWLHLKKQGNDGLGRITVSTVSSPWTEGTGTGYQKQTGSACFNWAQLNEKAWAYPGSDITAVINGQGDSRWGFADAEGPDAEGWYRVAVAPEVIAARIAGLSEGFAVIDDVGSEYTRDGEKFQYRLFPNRFVGSREAGQKNAPYFTLDLAEGISKQPPEAVKELKVSTQFQNGDPMPDGEALLTWFAATNTLGFDVRLKSGAMEMDVPRFLIPQPGAAGTRISMRLRDLALAPGAECELSVRAVDARGNRSVSAKVNFKTAQNNPALLKLPVNEVDPMPAGGEPLSLGSMRIFAIDALDKYDAVRDELIPSRNATYRVANHLWSAKTKTVRLFSARNECVAFQLVLAGDARKMEVNLKSPAGTDGRLYRVLTVPADRNPLPDPLIPWDAANATGNSTNTVIYVECYVPHTLPAGEKNGEIIIQNAGEPPQRINLHLNVWNFTLPDYLSFIPQMNCYSLPDAPADLAYYRMAHEHRTCLNRLAYNWRGQVQEGHAPKMVNGKADWSEWDARFGPLLDGSAFSDLPRAGVPVDAFYLPINENWPMPIEPAFRGGYWIENALSPDYWNGFRDGVEIFSSHLSDKKWNATFFEFYLNNKVYYKQQRNGWSGCSAPWILDEPVNTQDFWALRRYGTEFQSASAHFHDAVKLAFRLDISRPEWQRDLLDGIGDVFVMGGGMRHYERRVRDQKMRFGDVIYVYGSANRIEESNAQPVAWSLDTWCMGGDGVVPWQTMGTTASWNKADPLSLFYPGKSVGIDGPVPSLRLKAFRQGQQAVEYCILWQQATGRPRWAVEQSVQSFLGLKGELHKASEDDAGTISYEQADAERLWELRQRLGTALNAYHPEPKRKIMELRTPSRDTTVLRDPTVKSN